jgi:glycosyltransferase involved in cell wall biosynthesis
LDRLSAPGVVGSARQVGPSGGEGQLALRVCVVADGRSPIARSWIEGLLRAGYDVHVVSTFTCGPWTERIASLQFVPVAFSGISDLANRHRSNSTGALFRLRGTRLFRALADARRWLGPLDALRQAPMLRDVIRRIGPDVVHALRIPYEGILAAEALRDTWLPLVLSVWGNDFTLHAAKSPALAWMTRRALARADGLHPDCSRDLSLAAELGFDLRKPHAVLPGNGGLDTDVFCPGPKDHAFLGELDIPLASVVLNPRGTREYVRNDVFFESIPLVLRDHPSAVFVALAMKGNDVAESYVRRLGISRAVRLLPVVQRENLPKLFRAADVSVSPSEHDGTPNTLLEAMSCGSFPVAGDIASVREWIRHSDNGLLADPASASQLASCISRALSDRELRAAARTKNLRLVEQKAKRESVLIKVDSLYRQAVARYGT